MHALAFEASPPTLPDQGSKILVEQGLGRDPPIYPPPSEYLKLVEAILRWLSADRKQGLSSFVRDISEAR